ncbi:sensor histidine kinase [Marivita sp. GX14005]|uniref:sensor histidine kinase n=1 Tax=Marivita sp. GX14005 TaxID=2942276 RepID=UPI002019E2FE|nr:sensor histidine kinase [Marivita sp. GX14005]MCL3883167.1 sensor histidine kinase [Marivita sp. GX14005]
MTATSLRLRLFALILTPLLAVALLLGFWRYSVAQQTAEALFDRGLLAAALAISRDVAGSGGDALSPKTRALVSDAGGGEVFYHVAAPDGIYVTGYAYPPAFRPTAGLGEPEYRIAEYRGEPVRVLRLAETATIGNLTGESVVTVWQRVADRSGFAADLAWRAFALIGALMLTLALVVWFGVKRGLRPLSDLQDAIERRTPDDLSRIRRPVPVEVSGIVATLNRLFGQVEQSIQSHQAFISDAAHQLRNPASALLSLAESLPGTHDPAERQRRERALIGAARKSARLANQLLSMERLRYGDTIPKTAFDAVDMAKEVCHDLAPQAMEAGIEFSFVAPPDRLDVRGNRTLLAEALGNLVDNAIRHGGARLGRIDVSIAEAGRDVVLTVTDDGKGIPADQVDLALGRFSQLQPGEGSGLGLAFADQVARRHGGAVIIEATGPGASVSLRMRR